MFFKSGDFQYIKANNERGMAMYNTIVKYVYR